MPEITAPRTCLVLYGSETGNAQDIAEEVGKMFQRLHFESTVEEMNAVDLNALVRGSLVVFVLSTTGQGDMPHNSLLFWKRLLRKRLPPGCLSSLQYTWFGLGDSTYLKFNWAARKLTRRLDQLGASTFFQGYEADEQFPDGIDGSFARWSDDLIRHILDHHRHPDHKDPIPDDVMLPSRWTLEPALRQAQSEPTVSPAPPDLPIDKTTTDLLPISGGWTATLESITRLTPESHWQDVRLVSFNLPAAEEGPLQCNPGDCLTLYPKNFPQDVQKLIDLMGWAPVADLPLDLSHCGTLPKLLFASSPTTIRTILLNNVDITAIPRRSFLKNMSYYCTDEYHKEKLLEFNMTEYLDEYYDYATRSRRTIIEVLDEFTSVQIPPSRILDFFPLIRGRDFSIASGGCQLARHHGSTSVDLLVALVKYRTVLRKPREGLCSRYLASLSPGSQITVTHKPVLSPIHGAANAARPLIAMATGTGLAPVRCLIHERLTHASPPGPMVLFFGNRNKDADYFFAEEWKQLQKELENRSSSLTVFTAFSRDQREKIYVQDLVRQESARLADFLQDNPIFTVCGGSSKMADACKRAVFEPFLETGDQASNAVAERKQMLDNVTWWQEIW